MYTLKGKDGELRISDLGNNGTTHFLKVLFCEMDFVGPISRPRTEETLVLVRGDATNGIYFKEGPDDIRYAPIPVNFTAMLGDTIDSRNLSDLIGGSTIVNNIQLYSTKGTSTIDGNSLTQFVSAGVSKYTYTMEMLWYGVDNNFGFRYEETHFPPGEQTITESPGELQIGINGACYGNISIIEDFASAYTSLPSDVNVRWDVGIVWVDVISWD